MMVQDESSHLEPIQTVGVTGFQPIGSRWFVIFLLIFLFLKNI